MESEWEDQEAASASGRRPRRIYRLTESGQLVAERARRRLADTQRVLEGDLGGIGRAEAGS